MNAIRDCGGMGWLIVLFGLLGNAGSVACLVTVFATRYGRAPFAVGVATAIIGFIAFGLGPIGTMLGRTTTDNALNSPGINAAQRERIRAEGYRESDQCTELGTYAGPLPLIVGVVAIVVGRRRRKAERSPFTAPTIVPQ